MGITFRELFSISKRRLYLKDWNFRGCGSFEGVVLLTLRLKVGNILKGMEFNLEVATGLKDFGLLNLTLKVGISVLL